LQAIQNLNLEDTKTDRARDLFLIGAYTGLRVSDFNRLTNENIKELPDKTKYIQITAAKTNRIVEIPINSQVHKILKKNGNKPPKSMPEQKINLTLKTIGRLARINENVEIERTVGGSKEKTSFKKYQLITNHTARRSFCTNAYKAGLSTIDIMAISGHKSEAVFLKYIKITPNERLKRLASHEFFN
jgi:integrase